MSATASPSDAKTAIDPTRTETLRTRISGRLVGGLGKINSQLTHDVVTQDVFGTRLDEDQLANYPTDDTAGANYEAAALPALAYAPTSEQVRRFREWLVQEQEGAVRGSLSTMNNWALTRAYNKGIARAETELRTAGFDIESMDPSAVPRRETTLDEARSRFDGRLTTAINDTAAEATGTLQEGLEQGLAASALAAAIKERINHSRAGKNRLRNIAHGEVVRVANGGALDRYESAGASRVGAQVEVRVEGPTEGLPESVEPEDAEPGDEQHGTWSAVMDAATCPQCATLNDQTFRISDIRSGTAPMPVRDTHGFCRCWFNKPST